MNTYAFDTLTQAHNLQQCGFEEKQAKGIVQVIALATSNLTTKQDVEQLKLEMKLEMREECISIRNEMREECTSIRNEMREECTSIRNEMREECTSIRNDLMRLDKKILSMTIRLSIGLSAFISIWTGLLQWLN